MAHNNCKDAPMIRRLLATLFVAACLPAAAQSVPNANYTDMWWNPSESGWGITFMQHPGSNQAYATWYTFDSRVQDSSTGQSKPMWIVMSGGTWTSPNSITGRAFLLNGTPYNQSGSNRQINEVGTFTLTFSDFSNGTFSYNIAPPPNAGPNDPAASLQPMSGTRAITRFQF
jgi:hypothetical protein